MSASSKFNLSDIEKIGFSLLVLGLSIFSMYSLFTFFGKKTQNNKINDYVQKVSYDFPDTFDGDLKIQGNLAVGSGDSEYKLDVNGDFQIQGSVTEVVVKKEMF